jgi:predicted acetyltransferase
MSGIHLRDATDDDADALAAMAHQAFRFGDGASWGPYFRDNPHVRSGHTAMAFFGDDHAGNATALDLTMSVRGADVSVAGIAAVATSPGFRRRGVGQALLRALIQGARAKGTAWAMLHGISLAFYRRAGFGLAELDVLHIARGAAFAPSPTHTAVRPWVRAGDEAAVRDLYERLRAGTTGQLVRGDYWWSARVLRAGAEVVVAREGDAITGYAIYGVPEEPEYPQQRVVVSELRGSTPFAWRALFGWLDTLRDQYVEVRMLCAPSAALAMLREHGAREVDADLGSSADPFGIACAGVMARVVDLAAAVSSHRYEGPSRRVPLRVRDPLDDAPRDVDLVAEGGTVRVETHAGESDRLDLPVDALSTVILGATRAASLHAMGFVEGPGSFARDLDAMFPPTEPYLGPRNHF